MPKRIQKLFLIMTALVSLVFIFSCSTGDKTAVERTSITDVITGGESVVGPSGSDGTGGTGGGGSGACVYAATFCYQGTGITQSTCDYMTGTFYAGQSCEGLTYTSCSTAGGGTYLCSKP